MRGQQGNACISTQAMISTVDMVEAGPVNYKAAMETPEAAQRQEGVDSECSSVVKNKVLTFLNSIPTGKRVIPTKLILQRPFLGVSWMKRSTFIYRLESGKVRGWHDSITVYMASSNRPGAGIPRSMSFLSPILDFDGGGLTAACTHTRTAQSLLFTSTTCS